MSTKMVGLAKPNGAETDDGNELREVVAAIEELVAAFGVQAVVSASLRSTAGERLSQLGGNATLRISQVILREIAFSKDPRLEAEVMALGVGILLSDGETMRRLAAKHGLSPAAISKRVVTFCEENHLPPSIYMRSENDRKTYALTNQPRS